MKTFGTSLSDKMTLMRDGMSVFADDQRTPWLVKETSHTLGDEGLKTSLEMEVRDDPTTDKHRSHFRKGG